MVETKFKSNTRTQYLKCINLIQRHLYEIVSGNDSHNSIIGSVIFIHNGNMYFIHDTYSISNNMSINTIDCLPIHNFNDCLFRELTPGDTITITVK